MSEGKVLHELFPEGIYLIPENDVPSSPEKKESDPPVEQPAQKQVTNEATVQIEDEPTVNFKGLNNQEILVLYDGPAKLSGDEEVFLSKVLASVGLDMDDIALAYLPENTRSWEKIPAKKILLFGCEAVLPDAEKLYTPYVTSEKSFLRADSLNLIISDKQNKTLLWKALKQMFGL